MSAKRFFSALLICLLGFAGLTAQTGANNQLFGPPKQGAAPSKTAMGLDAQIGKAGARSFTYGAILDAESYNKLPVQDAVVGHPDFGTRGEGTRGPAQIPPAFSLKQYAPIPGEQGALGSCTGWATAYGAKTIMESITLKRTNRLLTTRNAYSPLYVYHKAREIDEWPDKTDGADLITVASLMKDFGVPRDVEYRKLGISLGSNNAKPNLESDNLKKWNITGINALFSAQSEVQIGSYSAATINSRVSRIKSNISQGNPVIIAIVPSDSFKVAGERWNPGPNEKPNMSNGHAVCVVGYDDNKYGGAFEILNSWSEYWGDGGFTWIDYQTLGKYLVQAAVLVDDYSAYNKPFEWKGKISVQTADNARGLPVRFSEDGVYTSKTSLKTGTQFRFVLEGNNKSSSDGPIYPYVFYTDKTLGKTVQVWPPSGNSAKAAIENGKPVAIPGNNQWITTNGSVKAEHFVFLFSRTELNAAAIRSAFEKQRGGAVMARLGAAAGDRFIPAAYGLYEYSSIESIIDFLDMESVVGMVFSTQYDKDGKMPMDLIKISGGSFVMGTPKSDPNYNDAETQRTVKINDFYIGEAAVTVGEFREFTASSKYKTSAEKNGHSLVMNWTTGDLDRMPKYSWSNPSFTQTDNYPVVHISWLDAVEYCNWRSKQDGLKPVYAISPGKINIDDSANGYRLPTEEEWEYACRAGTTTAYNTGGSSIPATLANFDESYIYKPAAVKSYPPNKWGLYEMHGNIFEWTQDPYGNSGEIFMRGGAWCTSDYSLRSANRSTASMDITCSLVGFRLVRSGG